MKRTKSSKLLITLIVVFFAVIFLWDSLSYVTYENEYSVKKQFGQIVSIKTTPGLDFKVPFIQTISKIHKSKQFYDLPQSDVITSDKKTMIADAYVIWHVTDPLKFTQALNANPTTAEGRIDVIVYNAIKTTVSKMTQEELVISRDDPIETANAEAELTDVDIKDINSDDISPEDTIKAETPPEVIAISKQLLNCVGNQCDVYGLSIDNVEIKVLDLPEENKDAVYERMITERNNIAAAYKAQGESEAKIIRNTTDKEVSIMKSEAQAQADKLVAEGEAEYMKILSDAYNDESKADFYLFTKSLDTAKASFNSKSNTLFLDKDSPLAQIFSGTSATSVPATTVLAASQKTAEATAEETE